MTGFRSGLHNFSKGILSKELWGRSDIAPYAAGVRRAENVHILKYGGLSKRPGSRLVYEIKDGAKRLIPFEGAYEASYVLTMGQATMRLAALGGMVVEPALSIEGATNANPVIITASFHGFANGDEVFFSGVLGMDEINGLMLPITVIDDSHFSVPVDGTQWGEFAGDVGGEVREEEPAPAPTPPPVPPPSPPPPPPPIGDLCVADDTLILMADGSERPAHSLVVGDRLRTRHELTWEWGVFKIEAIRFAFEPVYSAEGMPLATERHRFERFGKPGEWVFAGELGLPIGVRRVAKISVAGARTYMSRHPLPGSRWVLSHNIKFREAL